jgi:tripartite-type tricarboxylate transporter receptor subunit TctC
MRQLAWLVLAVSLLANDAFAADWPAKPVRLIAPFAAGGAADVVSRLLANALSVSLGQQFIVENRAGGGGLIAAQYVAHAEPDGYTLMVAGMSSHVIAPAISKSPGFDPVRDFTHMAFIGGAPTVILVHPSLGARTLKGLTDFVRSAAEGVEYVSAGTGTVGNLVAEYIATKDMLKLVHVPYKAGSGAVVDLLAGRVKVGSLNWTTAREHIASSRLIPLATSSVRRLAALPEVPTLKELGYADLVTTTWYVLSGPAGLPQEIVEKLNRETIQNLARPGLRRHLENEGAETPAYTAAEVGSYMQAQVERWAPIARTAIKAE